MNLLHAQPQVQVPSARYPEPPSAADTRLYGRRLILARTVWAVLAVFTLTSLAASFVVYAVHIRDACTAIPWITVCRLGQLVSGSMQLLGLSVDSYGIITVALMIFWALVWLVVAGVIFWYRSYDWMALLVSLSLILGAGSVISTTLLGEFDSRWQNVGQILGFLDNTLIFLAFSLFPNGRFVPRWMRWIAVALIALSIGRYFFTNSVLDYNSWPDLPNTVVVLGIFVSLVFAQIYRYLRVSSPVERQQTKWVTFAISVVFLGALVEGLGLETLPHYFPALSLPVPIYQFFDTIIWNFSIILIPICFAIAILRYRLYNIDIIINRTLVYGTLTATLAVVYVGSILVLQALSRGFTGSNQLALVGSTLAIAALFQPLRRRIQRVIDRRFYRSKYDATRTLAAFAGTLRGEIDLNELSERLVAVVQETMQPAHVSLWLRRASEQNMTQNTKAWVSHTLTPNQKELLPADQHLLIQPVSSLRGTAEYQAAPQKISRRTLIIGLATAGVAVAGGSFAGWVYRYPRLYTFGGHTDLVYTAVWSPDGKRIASGSKDKTVQVWDVTNGGHVFTYRGHTADVYTVAWSPDGSRIASSSADKTVQVWNATDGGHVFTYAGHTADVISVAWSPDGKYLASGSWDKTVQVWNATDGGHVFTYHGHSKKVEGVAWSTDSKRIASASFDKTVQVWNATDGGHVFTYLGHSSDVYTPEWSPDGKQIASASADKTVQVWNATDGGHVFTYRGHTAEVYTMAWSPDGRRIASASADTTVQVWDAADGGNIYVYRGHSDAAITVAWSPDGRRIASTSVDGTVQIWSIE